MNLPHKPHHLAGFAGLLAADAVVFGATNAKTAPSWILITGFGLLLVSVYWLAHGLIVLARLYGLSIRRKHRLAGSLTALIGCLVALQSVGDLNSHDIAVLLPLIVIAYLYSFYASAGARSSDL